MVAVEGYGIPPPPQAITISGFNKVADRADFYNLHRLWGSHYAAVALPESSRISWPYFSAAVMACSFDINVRWALRVFGRPDHFHRPGPG